MNATTTPTSDKTDHDKHRERLRAELLEKFGHTDPVTVLEALLTFGVYRKDTCQTAKDLLQRHGGSLRAVVLAALTENPKGITNYQRGIPFVFAVFREMCRCIGEESAAIRKAAADAVRQKEKDRQPPEIDPSDALMALLSYVLPADCLQAETERLLSAHDQNVREIIDCYLDPEQHGYADELGDLFAVFRALRYHYDQSPVKKNMRVDNNRTVVDIARIHLRGLANEEIWAALVDAGLRIIKWKQFGYGGLDNAFLNLNELLRECIVDRATALVLVHNHPGGGLTPSKEDLDLTKRLLDAGKIVNVEILEHLIITDDGYYPIIEHHFKIRG